MTISREERLKNVEVALRVLMEELCDASVVGNSFDRPDPNYSCILETTWDELEAKGYIRSGHPTMGGVIAFTMTGKGWIEGVKLTGQLYEIRRYLPQLCRAAKNRVKGRKQDELVHVNDLAKESGLSRALAENMIESRLLEIEYPGRIMKLEWDAYGSYSLRQFVRIPRRFGLERLESFDF